MEQLIPKYNLKIEDTIIASQNKTRIKISEAGKKKILQSRAKLARALALEKPVYGVNTGFGALVQTTIPIAKRRSLQFNLIKSHALGTGNYFEKSVVRAAMFLRANMLSKGYSGVRLELVKLLIDMLNRNIIPVVYEKGSVGASGDLAPLSFIALTLIGKSKAFYSDKIMNSKIALKKAGLKPITFEPKEGLALINGTEMMSAQGAIDVIRADHLINLADITGALSFVGLGGNVKAFDAKASELKPYPGQKLSAKNLRNLISTNSNPNSLQNAYSLRCMPQVHGAVRDGVRYARDVVEIEMNSVTDNPIIFDKEIMSGGNFHGQAIAFAMDNLAINLCALGGIAERRISRLLDPSLSGLPAFLSPSPGVNSGLMMTQLLAATLMTENKILATPASIHSLPTSANQEDFVSMGMDSALKAKRIIENTSTILALELINACQAIELAKIKLNKRLKKYFDIVRSVVPFQKTDQELTGQLHALTQKLYQINL